MIFPCNSTLPLKQKLKHSEPSLQETGGGLGGARTEPHARSGLRLRAPSMGLLLAPAGQTWFPVGEEKMGAPALGG